MPVLTKINTNSIADDAITAEKYSLEASGYVANTTNQNISGTYSDNRMYTSDAYTLSANATINSHLTLSTVKPTDDVVLTAGGAYTLTGTGVLSAGALLAPANTDLTGMTGELGSAVTGSPNLNLTTGTLGSGVTLPAGHIVQTVYLDWDGTDGNTSATSYQQAGNLSITITPIYTNSLIEVDWYVSSTHYNKGNGNSKGFWILRNVTQGHYIPGSVLHTNFAGGNSFLYLPTHGQGHEVLSTGEMQTYAVYVKTVTSQVFYWTNPASGSFGRGAEDPAMTMTAREIKQ